MRFEEHTLAGDAIAGNESSLQALWQRHRRWVAAILLAHKPRDAELDDLLQEVAMSLVKNIHTLADPALVRPWLRSVAINAARSAGRKQRVVRRAMPIVAEQTRRAADAEDHGQRTAASDADLGKLALEAAQSLPPEYREPLILRAVRGMSYRQIADIMNVPMTTVETRLARARRMLKAQLEQPASSRKDQQP